MNKGNLKNSKILRFLLFRYRKWLKSTSFNHGRNNRIICRGVRVASKLQFIGNDNTISIGTSATIFQSLIKINGNNNRVIIHDRAYISGADLWVEDNDCLIEIGANTFIGHHSHLACTENCKKLIVGRDCMLSSNVQIRTGDSHSILNIEGHRINHAADVFVGDHCWLGEGCRVLKGAALGENSVVSTGAVVTKSYGNNVLLGGGTCKGFKREY